MARGGRYSTVLGQISSDAAALRQISPAGSAKSETQRGAGHLFEP
jgi:hypothetical protein